MNYLKKAKLILCIETNDESKDELLGLYIDITMQEILNYCNITELPEALELILIRLAAEMYRESEAGTVSVITEDGRSVSFENAAASVRKRINRNDELKQFRKLYR
jgi:hypothetical protein